MPPGGAVCILAILAALVLTTGRAVAQAPESLGRHQRAAVLDKALGDFDEGLALLESEPDQAAQRLRAAAEGFEAVIRSGVNNGRLFYNLGNTYLQLDRLGPAIANYRRAERLIPGDEQLKTNLACARGLCRNQIALQGSKTLVQTLFFWHYRVPLPTRFFCALVLYVLFWLVLIVRPFLPQLGLRLLVVVLAVGWLTFGLSAAVEWRFQSRTVAGVITADEVDVLKGNSAHYEAQFRQLLYEGVEFTVIEHRDDWLRIELPDGNTGWIRTNQAELI